MWRPHEMIGAVLAAAGLLIVAGPAMAAEPAPGGFAGWLLNPVPETLPFRLTGEVDISGQKLEGNRNSPNFRTYRVIEEGFVANRLRLGLETKDQRWFMNFQGTDISKDDQNYKVTLGKYGRYRLDLEWDEIPHLYAQQARSAFERSTGADGGTVYNFPTALATAVQSVAALPAATRPARQAAVLSQLNGSTVFDIKTRNDVLRAGLWWAPIPEFDVQLNYDHTRRAGNRPMGGGFGSPGGSVLELPEPIQWKIDQLNAIAGYSTPVWQVQGGYRLSLFNNDIKTMTFNNPLIATTTALVLTATGGSNNSSIGRTVLAPDNQAHNLFFTGGVNLPMATRLTAKVAYGITRQDDAFFPHTVNPVVSASAVAAPLLQLPAPSLRGDVRTLLINATGTTRPLPDVSVTAAYRFFKNDNRTLDQSFPGHVVRDEGFVNETRFSHVHDYDKHNADLDVAYRILRPLTLRAGFGWERWERSPTQETELSDEYSAKFGLSYRPLSWIEIKPRYVRSWRRIDFYNTLSHAEHRVPEEDLPDESRITQSPLLRKFPMAARDRHKAEVLFRLMPMESLDVGINLGYAQDRYPWSFLGLQEDKNWNAGVDVGYTPFQWLTLRGNYAHEEYHSKQRSRSRPGGTVAGAAIVGDFVGFEWISRNVDVYDTIGAGTIFRLIPDKLDLQADYGYQRGISRINSFNPFEVQCTAGHPLCTPANRITATANSFPDNRFSLHRIGGVLRYWVLKNLALRAGYTYERFRESYWQTDFIQPVNFAPPITTSPLDVFLGAKPFQSYEAHIIGGGLTYGF